MFSVINTTQNIMKTCRLRTLLIAGLCLSFTELGESSQQVIKDMSITFTKALNICKKEMSLPETINDDFNNFWKEDYVIANRQTGCAIMCLSTKLEIVDPDLNLHHGNAQEYVTKHGADEQLAKELVDIIHQCEKTVKSIDDDCLMVLEWAKCFKVEIHKKEMAPEMDIMVAEVIAEAHVIE